ncbi:MAG: trypsin-like peptidase domain-containing protein [Lactobacillales bacterium]|nr:trypsin-like peptidase domain-containing protein [Lactobacillales bacterium]
MSESKGKIFGLGLAGGLLGASLISGGISVLNGDLFGTRSTIVEDAGKNRVSKEVFKNSTNVTEAVKKVQNTVVSVVNLQPHSPTQSQGNGGMWSIFGDDSSSDEADDSGELKPFSEGSGVIYKKAENKAYIVTNAHVVDGQKGLEIILADGTKVTGTLIGSDVYSDVAVIQISAEKVTQVATWGDSSKLTVGEPAIAFGSPLGSEYANSVTEGIISSLNRQVTNQNEKGEIIHTNALQTDAAINQGNSGGPLVNIEGQAIGITSSKISAGAGTSATVEGMGFAIPSNDVVSIINKLEAKGKVERPALGILNPVSLSNLTKQQIEKILKIPADVKNGLVLQQVSAATPADVAGLKKYDVITEFDGKEVKDFIGFQSLLYTHEVGDTVKVTYYREKEKKTVDVKLTLDKSSLEKKTSRKR